MKNMQQQVEGKLLDYIDGNLSDDETQKLEAMLLKDEALRSCLKELKMVDFYLKALKVEQPTLNFTDQVMKAVDAQPVSENISPWMGKLLLAGILTVSLLTSLLVSSGFFDGIATLPDLDNINYFNFSMPVINISGKLMINIIIFLNVALALLVLDRAVLKPFFKRRMAMR
jgi:hypothetical protein